MLQIRAEQMMAFQVAAEQMELDRLRRCVVMRHPFIAADLGVDLLNWQLRLAIVKGKTYRLQLVESYVQLFLWMSSYGPKFDDDPRIRKVLAGSGGTGDGQLGIVLALELLPPEQ